MNKTVKNSAIYLMGTIILALLGFASAMILTRIVSNQVYAMYGLLNTFSTAVITFVAFGYDSSYTRFYYKHGYTQKQFMYKSLKVPCFIFLAFAIVALEPSHTLLNYIFETNFSFIAIIILLMYILFSFVHRFSQLTARMEEYACNYILSNIIAKSGFLLLTIIAFALFGTVSFNMILFSFMVTNLVAVLINLKVFLKSSNKIIASEQMVDNKELLNYGFPLMINNFLVLMIPMLEKLIVRDLAGWEILSIFTAASIFQTVILLITTTLNNIWQPMVFKHFSDKEKFQPMMHKFGVCSSILISLILAFCILARRWLILLLDDAYFRVYIIAPVILWGACFNIISMIYSIGINIEKKTVHLIISPLLQALVSIGLCYWLIPEMGLVGVGLSLLFSIVIGNIYKIFVGLHYYNTGRVEYHVFVLFVWCTIVSVMSMFFTSLLADFIMGVLIIGVMLMLNIKSIKPLLIELRNFVKK